MEKYGNKIQRQAVEDEEVLNSLARLARCCSCQEFDNLPCVEYWCSEHGFDA